MTSTIHVSTFRAISLAYLSYFKSFVFLFHNLVVYYSMQWCTQLQWVTVVWWSTFAESSTHIYCRDTRAHIYIPATRSPCEMLVQPSPSSVTTPATSQPAGWWGLGDFLKSSVNTWTVEKKKLHKQKSHLKLVCSVYCMSPMTIWARCSIHRLLI